MKKLLGSVPLLALLSGPAHAVAAAPERSTGSGRTVAAYAPSALASAN